MTVGIYPYRDCGYFHSLPRPPILNEKISNSVANANKIVNDLSKIRSLPSLQLGIWEKAGDGVPALSEMRTENRTYGRI
jgi:hypothetical protein